jgi:recombinational DNA repair protein RecR
MIALIPQLVLATTTAGAMMIRLGISRDLLAPRRVSRNCRSCGRLIEGRVCEACAGSRR